MSFFKHGITLYECKDYLYTNSLNMRPEIIINEPTHMKLKFKHNNRSITICVFQNDGYPITVDVEDSFFMLREPRKTFRTREKYQTYIFNILQKIRFLLYTK